MTDLDLRVRLKADSSGLVGEVRVSREALDKLGDTTRKTGDRARDARGRFIRMGDGQRRAGQESRRLNNEQKNLGRQLDKTARNVNLLRLAVVTLATGMGARLVRSFIEAGETTEQYQLRLRRLLGDVEEARLLFDDMAEFASRVPFEYREIMEAATALSGVLQGGREEIADIMPLIADLAAVTQLSIADTTQQVIRMFSSGAASADLLRERGVLAMLGFQAGVTVSAEETRERLIAAWEDPLSRFRGAADDLAGTWSGQLSMMEDRWFQYRNLVMAAGPYDFLVASLAELNAVFDETSEETGQNAREMGEAIVAGLEATLLGTADVIDALDMPITFLKQSVNGFLEFYNSLPPWAQEMGLIAGILIGRKALLAVAAVGTVTSHLDDLTIGITSVLEGLGAMEEGSTRLLAEEVLRNREEGKSTILPGLDLDLFPGTTLPLIGDVDLASGSLAGGDSDTARSFVEGVFARVHGRISEAAAGVAGHGDGTGAGDGGGNEKARERIDERLFEIEMLDRTAREQAVLAELRKAGVQATIRQGESLSAFLARLGEEERLLADVVLLGEERASAIDLQIAAQERHAGIVADITDRLMALKPAYGLAVAAAEQWRTEALAGLDPLEEGYDDFVRQIEEIHGVMLADAYDEDLRNRRDWAAGVERSLRDAANEAGDQAAAFEDLTVAALDQAEDVWVEFFRNRKLDFDDFGAFLEDWFARYLFRRWLEPGLHQAADALAGQGGDIPGGIIPSILGGIIPSIFGGATEVARSEIQHTGGVVGRGTVTRDVPLPIFAGARRFHGGGRILAPGEVPIIARAGELVSTPEQVDNMGALIASLAAVAARGPGDLTVEVVNNTGVETTASVERTRRPGGGDALRVTLDPVVASSIESGEGGRAIERGFHAARRLIQRD